MEWFLPYFEFSINLASDTRSSELKEFINEVTEKVGLIILNHEMIVDKSNIVAFTNPYVSNSYQKEGVATILFMTHSNSKTFDKHKLSCYFFPQVIKEKNMKELKITFRFLPGIINNNKPELIALNHSQFKFYRHLLFNLEKTISQSLDIKMDETAQKTHNPSNSQIVLEIKNNEPIVKTYNGILAIEYSMYERIAEYDKRSENNDLFTETPQEFVESIEKELIQYRYDASSKELPEKWIKLCKEKMPPLLDKKTQSNDVLKKIIKLFNK